MSAGRRDCLIKFREDTINCHDSAVVTITFSVYYHRVNDTPKIPLQTFSETFVLRLTTNLVKIWWSSSQREIRLLVFRNNTKLQEILKLHFSYK